MLRMAKFYEDQGKHREALNIYLYIINSSNGTETPNAAELYKAAGDRLLDLKEYGRAKEFLYEAKKHAKSDQNGPINESLAEALFYLNDYAEAESLFKKAMDDCISEMGANAPECMTIRANLEKARKASESPPGFVG